MKNQGYSKRFIDACFTADSGKVGVQLGRICISRDVTISDVASALNVSRQIVYLWFTGGCEPHPSNLTKIQTLMDQIQSQGTL